MGLLVVGPIKFVISVPSPVSAVYKRVKDARKRRVVQEAIRLITFRNKERNVTLPS